MECSYSCIFSIVSSLCLLFSFPTCRELASLSRILLWSLLEWMPTWTVGLLTPSRCTHCRWHISSHALGPLGQFAGLCSILGQRKFIILPSGHEVNIALLSQLFGKRKPWSSSEWEEVPWNAICGSWFGQKSQRDWISCWRVRSSDGCPSLLTFYWVFI